jgi:alkylation response protein AidB-like acyl-CoA dehydrogenase
MDFDFTDDQEQLRDAVRKWVDKATTLTAAAASPRPVVSHLKHTVSWLTWACRASGDDGGLGMGPAEGMVVMEELGRGMVMEPFIHLIASGVLSGYTR